MSNKNSRDSTVYFFRETEDNGHFSQWFRCYFEYDGLQFNCTEQWMMWQKAKLSGDEGTAAIILRERSPRKQKSLGRRVENFNEALWNKKKLEIVEQGNYLKYTQCTDAGGRDASDTREPIPLKQLMLDTGSSELVEASPYDKIWGIGFSAADAKKSRPKWGQNLLGLALMNVRERIRNEMEQEQEARVKKKD